MIDLVSEAESIYSEFSVRGYWVSSCWKHTHMRYCMASRDTMPGLHLAEHKWVKRNYNKEQSSLLTPPQEHTGSYNQPRHCSRRSACWAPRRRASRSALMAWVIKHCSRWGEKGETSIDLKMSCSVIFKSFHLYFFLSVCWQSASGHGSGVYRMFCDQFFFFVPACVCVLMHVSNLVSCRIHTRRQESHISDKVQPIKYNSWLLQCLWIVVITLVLVCV